MYNNNHGTLQHMTEIFKTTLLSKSVGGVTQRTPLIQCRSYLVSHELSSAGSWRGRKFWGSIAQGCSNKPQKWSRAPLSVSCVLWLKLLRLLSYACPHFGFFSTNIFAKMLNYFLSQCWFCHWCNTANRVPAIWPSAKTKLFIVTEKLSIFIVIHKVCCQKPKRFHMRAARGYETDKYRLEQDERFHNTNKTTRVLTSFTPSINI